MALLNQRRSDLAYVHAFHGNGGLSVYPTKVPAFNALTHRAADTGGRGESFLEGQLLSFWADTNSCEPA
jgi:hypothetical protein